MFNDFLQQLNPKRVLITGARAPAALEWARLLQSAGVYVVAADTLRYPLTRFSNTVDVYERLPAPADGVAAYGQAIDGVCKRHNIDLVIPTCEEIFYLAHQQAHISAKLLTPNFSTLRTAHNKFMFSVFSKQFLVSTPPTQLLQSDADLHGLSAAELSMGVLKPVWSRFANQTLIKPVQQDIKSLSPSPEAPWIWQQFASGREVCSYSVAVEGKVLVHTLYHPKHRVGRGSGIYFEPIANKTIEDFVTQFCERLNWTGQVAFDYIETNEGEGKSVQVLECNPRATSGVHLMRYESLQALQISFAMWLFGLPKAMRRPATWWHDYCRAKDAIAVKGDAWPLWVQPLCLIEIVWRALSQRKKLLAAATSDIEWNGEDLDAV